MKSLIMLIVGNDSRRRWVCLRRFFMFLLFFYLLVQLFDFVANVDRRLGELPSAKAFFILDITPIVIHQYINKIDLIASKRGPNETETAYDG